MPQLKRKRIKLNPPKGSTREKGDIVEQIVAIMHEGTGVQIERNVFLPTQDSSGRTREFDVMLTSEVAGYPVRLVIECKNERKLVSVAEIDKFIGKMNDVGIPTQQGIFVSVSGYTSDATLRAQKAGIKTLILKDLSEKLSDSVREAFQSLVYLLATLTNIQIAGVIPEDVPGGLALFFRNKDGMMCAIPDLVWDEWRAGRITDKLGVTGVELKLPKDWGYFQGGKVPTFDNIIADVQVSAHLITLSTSIKHHILVDAMSKKTSKFNLQASFQHPHGVYEVRTLLAEEELQALMNNPTGVNVFVGRFRLPRIRWMSIYWPPSEKSLRKLFGLAIEAIKEGKEFDMSKLDLADIEGTDMKSLWDPIWKEHPAAKDSANKERESL